MRRKILVVEDDERIAATIRRSLTYEGYEVAVAHDGPEGLVAARKEAPDLVLLDLMLPGIDGLEVCRRIRAESEVPVLMLTAMDGVADRVRGLDTGADDYLVKPFAYEELLARVRALLRRAVTGAEELLRCGDLSTDIAAMEVHRGDRAIEMTALEFRLLEYFLRNQRVVLTRPQILDQVWGLDVETTSNVVDVYVGYLRQKLEIEHEPRLIHTVRGVGYVLKES